MGEKILFKKFEWNIRLSRSGEKCILKTQNSFTPGVRAAKCPNFVILGTYSTPWTDNISKQQTRPDGPEDNVHSPKYLMSKVIPIKTRVQGNPNQAEYNGCCFPNPPHQELLGAKQVQRVQDQSRMQVTYDKSI